jgi:methylamine dehydrogenase heavy chain
MMTRVGAGAVLAVALTSAVALAEVPAEEPGVAPVPAVSPHWVFLTDLALFNLSEGKIVIVDGDQGRLVATLTTGYLADNLLSPDGKELYVAETFWSRGTRGERTDVVTIFDMTTFKPVAEVKIPGRFLAVTQPYNVGLSPDGRFFHVFNLDPATSVTVVDIKARAVVAEIATPGCGIVLPAKDKFLMPCGDGTFLQVNLDSAGKETSRSRTEAIFDVDADPISERPARTSTGYAFTSYAGKVYEVDASGDEPVYAAPWPLATEEEAAAGWRPGGWEQVAYAPHSNELFVAMHQGGPGTHELPGPEIWVYDMAQKKKVRVIKPEEPVLSLAVSSDDKPILAAVTETLGLSIMDAASGAQLSSMTGLTQFGLVLETP